MNRKYAAFAVSAMAMGAIALTATEASAVVTAPMVETHSTRLPPEPDHGPVPGPSGPRVEIPVDDVWAEAAQAGASALGGAGIAFAGLFVYRRRQLAHQ